MDLFSPSVTNSMTRALNIEIEHLSVVAKLFYPCTAGY